MLDARRPLTIAFLFDSKLSLSGLGLGSVRAARPTWREHVDASSSIGISRKIFNECIFGEFVASEDTQNNGKIDRYAELF
jgi:hypothetical protein